MPTFLIVSINWHALNTVKSVHDLLLKDHYVIFLCLWLPICMYLTRHFLPTYVRSVQITTIFAEKHMLGKDKVGYWPPLRWKVLNCCQSLYYSSHTDDMAYCKEAETSVVYWQTDWSSNWIRNIQISSTSHSDLFFSSTAVPPLFHQIHKCVQILTAIPILKKLFSMSTKVWTFNVSNA